MRQMSQCGKLGKFSGQVKWQLAGQQPHEIVIAHKYVYIYSHTKHTSILYILDSKTNIFHILIIYEITLSQHQWKVLYTVLYFSVAYNIVKSLPFGIPVTSIQWGKNTVCPGARCHFQAYQNCIPGTIFRNPYI